MATDMPCEEQNYDATSYKSSLPLAFLFLNEMRPGRVLIPFNATDFVRSIQQSGDPSIIHHRTI